MLYCIYDLETTGLEAKKDEIFELGSYICNNNLQIINRIQYKIIVKNKLLLENPDNKALKYYNEDVWKKEGMDVDAALGHFSELLRSYQGEKIIPVGHNINFDLGFIKEFCERGKIRYPFYYNFIDTIGLCMFYDIANGINRKWYTLESITKDLGLKHSNAHTSMGDVDAVYKLLLFFKEKFNFNNNFSLL